MALAQPLSPATPLARFSAGRDIRAEQAPRVKAQFMSPRWDDRADAWALSTSRVDGMTPEQTRSFGIAWVERVHGEGRTLKAHCEIPVGAVESAAGGVLRADFDNDPPRHVNVVDWPSPTEDQLEIAQELCALIETVGHIARY